MSNPFDLSNAIPINYSDSLYGFENPSNSDEYTFELTLISTTNKSLTRKKKEKKKYACILKREDKIKYRDINYYTLKISGNSVNEVISDYLDHKSKSYHKRSGNVYIEFYEDNNGYAICTCYYLGNNDNGLFISPPV